MNIWKKLPIEPDRNFIIKFEKANDVDDLLSNKITCWLSDFKAIWMECFETGADMLERVKTTSSWLSVDRDRKIILKTLTAIPTDETFLKNCQIEEDNGNLKLNLKYHLGIDIPLKFNWRLKKCTEQEFFEQITKRMLWQIGALTHDNEKLIELIKKKDQEIEQYKLEGAAPLTRKQLVTEPFQLFKDLVSIALFEKGVVETNSGFVTPPPIPPAISKNEEANTEKTEDESVPAVSNVEKKVPQARDWRKRPPRPNDRYKPTPSLEYDDSSDSELSQELSTEYSSKYETQQKTVETISYTGTTTKEPPKKIRKKLNM